MEIQVWLAFVAASVVLLVIPGPTILAVTSYSMTHGRRASAPLVAGVALGDCTALIASLLGMGALLSSSALLFTAVKVVGGLYLIYLGVSLFRAKVKPATESIVVGTRSRWNIFLNIYLVTALNPKGIIFFVAFLPQFVSMESNVTFQLSILAITFVCLATINAAAYAYFAASITGILKSERAQRRFNLTGGALLIMAGLWTLLARRTV